MAKTVLDLMEYINDGLAQAAYVSSEAEVVDQQNITTNDNFPLGDVGGDEKRFAHLWTKSIGVVT